MQNIWLCSEHMHWKTAETQKMDFSWLFLYMFKNMMQNKTTSLKMKDYLEELLNKMALISK